MTTSNPRLMKTQIIPGPYDLTLFPVPSAKVGKSGGVNGGIPNFPRLKLEPIVAERISARTSAHYNQNHSGLPASLKDWLARKEALEICQRGRDGTEDGDHAWGVTAKPATRAKSLSATSMRPQTAL